MIPSGAGAASQVPGELPAPLEEAEIPPASRCQGRARTLQAVGPSPGKVPRPPADPVGLKRSWEHSDFGAPAPWLAARIKSSQILPNLSARWGRACRDRERLAQSPLLIPWPFCRAALGWESGFARGGGHRRGDRVAAAGLRPSAPPKTRFARQRCSLAVNPSDYDSFHPRAGYLRNGCRGLWRPSGVTGSRRSRPGGGGWPWMRAGAAVGL